MTALNQLTLIADLHLFDVTGNVVARLEGLSVKRFGRKAFQRWLKVETP